MKITLPYSAKDIFRRHYLEYKAMPCALSVLATEDDARPGVILLDVYLDNSGAQEYQVELARLLNEFHGAHAGIPQEPVKTIWERLLDG